MKPTMPYVIRTDITFGALEKIDIDALQKACTHEWFNQTLCKVNESLVRLGIFKRAQERTLVLMVEAATVNAVGDDRNQE